MIQRPDRKITDILNEGPFTLSAEIVPPRNGANPEVLEDQLRRLTTCGTEFMAVTKGAGGSLRGGSLPIAQAIKQVYKLPCIAHFTSRDLTPEEVENQLVDHHLFGIRNILALRGDPPQGVADWVPREGSYPYAYQLVEQIVAMNEGRYLERSGFKTECREKMDFCVGVACYPDHPDSREQHEFFQKKIDVGAEYAISQMLFDHESYARFLEASRHQIPVLPGTRLLKSQEQAKRMASRFAIPIPDWYMKLLPTTDAEASPERSLAAFLDLTEKLKSAGAPGIHIFVLSDTELSEQAFKTLSGLNSAAR